MTDDDSAAYAARMQKMQDDVLSGAKSITGNMDFLDYTEEQLAKSVARMAAIVPTEPACGRCHFYVTPEPAPFDSLGTCHRNAPVSDSHNFAGRAWPTVTLTDWCGEFQAEG